MTKPKRIDDELVEFVARRICPNAKDGNNSFYICMAKSAVEAIQEWDAGEVKNDRTEKSS